MWRFILKALFIVALLLAGAALYVLPDITKPLMTSGRLTLSIERADGTVWIATDIAIRPTFYNYAEEGDCARPPTGLLILTAEAPVPGPDTTPVRVEVVLYDVGAVEDELASDSISQITLSGTDGQVQLTQVLDPDETVDIDISGGWFQWRFDITGTQTLVPLRSVEPWSDSTAVSLSFKGSVQATTSVGQSFVRLPAFCL